MPSQIEMVAVTARDGSAGNNVVGATHFLKLYFFLNRISLLFTSFSGRYEIQDT